MKKDIIAISDLSKKDIEGILALTDEVKKHRQKYAHALAGACAGLIFQKPSNRTRVSFEIGMFQLGGHSVYLGPSELEMGKRESVKDIARVLSRYLDVIIARTYSHSVVEELAEHASVPVINGLSDRAHPCQALSDIFTIRERFGGFGKVRLAYIGDANNVLNSLAMAAAKVGLAISIASPKGYEIHADIMKQVRAIAAVSGSKVSVASDPAEAARHADVVYTDVWVSMGQERERAKRTKAFRSFQVNEALLRMARKRCMVMHCLPAHRGQEITDAVIDGTSSAVYDQAENRLHAEKAILLMLLGNRTK